MAEQFTPTLTPEATGGVGAIEEVGAQLNRASLWDSAFGLLGTAAKTAAVLTEEDKLRAKADKLRQDKSDMAEASVYASGVVQDVSQMPAGDQHAAYEGIVEGIQSGESTRSDTYNRTLLNSILPKYTSAGIERKRQLTETDIRMSTDTLMLSSFNERNFADIPATLNEEAKRIGVDVARVRDSFYGSYYGYYKDRISGITDEGELNKVLAEMTLSDKALSSPKLLGNSSTGESGKFLRGQKQAFASALSQAQSAITKRNALIVKDTENKADPNPRGRYPQHPQTIKDRYPDPVAYKEAVQLYTENSNNVEQADNYNTETGTNFTSLDEGAQTIIKQDITTSLVNNFDDFDGSTLANTLISQKQNAGDGVAHIKANLYSVDELASAETFLKIQELRGQPNGEEALNVIFSDEGERTKYDAIVALQESGIVGSMFEANKFMNQPKTAWKFDGKREEQKFNSLFEGVPVNLANRGKNTYKALRSRGAGHDVAVKAAEKSIEAKADVGGVTIHGSNQPFDNSETVKSSIGTHLNAMTAPFGEEITHHYDMWNNNIVSTNEFGVIISTSNRDELVDLATSVEAFKRDVDEHYIREGAGRAGDAFNSMFQEFVRVQAPEGTSITSGFVRTSATGDPLWDALTSTYGPSSFAARKAIKDKSSKRTIQFDDTEPTEVISTANKEIAAKTMSRIYEKEVVGTKQEKVTIASIKYINQLSQLAQSMPELDNSTDAQMVLENIHNIEAKTPIEYTPKGDISRETVDTLNGRLAIQKEAVAEIRKSMDLLSINNDTEVADEKFGKWQDISKDGVNKITGKSGTITERNNNPGALKLDFKGALIGTKVGDSERPRKEALVKAKKLYDGVVTIDRGGFIIFKDVLSGKKAQAELMTRSFKDDTVSKMLPKYAVADGSGETHHIEYEKSIYKHTDKLGFNLRTKKIGDMSIEEIEALTGAMARVEGGTSI